MTIQTVAQLLYSSLRSITMIFMMMVIFEIRSLFVFLFLFALICFLHFYPEQTHFQLTDTLVQEIIENYDGEEKRVLMPWLEPLKSIEECFNPSKITHKGKWFHQKIEDYLKINEKQLFFEKNHFIHWFYLPSLKAVVPTVFHTEKLIQQKCFQECTLEWSLENRNVMIWN